MDERTNEQTNECMHAWKVAQQRGTTGTDTTSREPFTPPPTPRRPHLQPLLPHHLPRDLQQLCPHRQHAAHLIPGLQDRSLQLQHLRQPPVQCQTLIWKLSGSYQAGGQVLGSFRAVHLAQGDLTRVVEVLCQHEEDGAVEVLEGEGGRGVEHLGAHRGVHFR